MIDDNLRFVPSYLVLLGSIGLPGLYHRHLITIDRKNVFRDRQRAEGASNVRHTLFPPDQPHAELSVAVGVQFRCVKGWYTPDDDGFGQGGSNPTPCLVACCDRKEQREVVSDAL